LSLGQAAEVPVQVSATSHDAAPPVPGTAARHTTVFSLKLSVGQPFEAPVQVSAWSHTSAAARQLVPALATASFGQLPLEPVQYSATSHELAPPLPATAGRHTTLLA
jgi:hypothetical protein